MTTKTKNLALLVAESSDAKKEIYSYKDGSVIAKLVEKFGTKTRARQNLRKQIEKFANLFANLTKEEQKEQVKNFADVFGSSFVGKDICTANRLKDSKSLQILQTAYKDLK